MSMPSPFLDEIERPPRIPPDLESPFADDAEAYTAPEMEAVDVDEEADPEDDELAGEATPLDDQMESWISFPWWTPPQPAPTGLSSSRLAWPGASSEQLTFMRRVYDAHVARAVGRGDKFTPSLPGSQLETIHGDHQARRDAAGQAKRLLQAANADLKAAGLADRVRIGITSAYRSADRQFDIWQGKGGGGRRGFPHYYRVTEAMRRKTGDEHGAEAVQKLAEYMGKYIAAPGYSNHQDGLAIDFGTGEIGKSLGKIGARSWFHGWLVKNARRYGFHPYEAEAWHWVYRPGTEMREEELVDPWAVGTPTSAVTAGVLEIGEVPMLRAHRGKPPDLVLRWNAMPSADAVDVVVHLHGYTRPNMQLRRDIEPWAGIDLQPVDGADGATRTRPTLTVLPHGHDTGVKRGKINRYTFPALTADGAIDRLVTYALEQFGRRVGAGQTPRRGRLILTAHSGGGAPLMRILRSIDPDEVHVHDGLYQDASVLAAWALKRIRRDRALVDSSAMPEGGMRVFYRPGTAKYSRALVAALRKELAAAPEIVRRRYRVEASTLGHWQIPRQYGYRILADVAADVPASRQAPQGEVVSETPDEAFESQAPLDFDTEVDENNEEAWDSEAADDVDDEELVASLDEAPVFDEEEPELELEGETPASGVLTYPSGETLEILTGLPEGDHEDYWDPTGSGNPLVDAGPAQKDKRLSTSFTVRELTTSGGVSADVARIDPAFVAMLQRLRDHLGRPITITSGYRSWKRNAKIYADRNKRPTLSQHCGGRAADIKVGGMNGVEIARAALAALGPNIGIGLGNTFAHVDNRGHAEVWDYGGAPDAWIAEIRRLQREAGGRSGRASSPPATASELVQFAQRVLNAVHGDTLDDDGKLGPLTRAALERFRSRNGLGAGSALDSGTQVALVQRALEEIARQSMFAQVGVLDATTASAISDFKRQRGLGDDPSVDAGVRRALTEALASAGSIP